MSETDLNTQPKPLKLELLELEGSIPVNIPDEVFDKIKFLCMQIPNQEWSGILFYTVEGSIRDAANMVIHIKDLFLMDIDTKTTTSFDWDADIVDYRMDNPESLDWIVGHIHSHNSMSVFFSPTDMGELNDNCPRHNFYLSLIVNNYNDMKAKIAMFAQIPHPDRFICKDETGEDFKLTLRDPVLTPYMFLYDCIINYTVVKLVVPNNFEDRFKDLTQKHLEKVRTTKAAEVKNPALSGGLVTSMKGTEDDRRYKSRFPDYNNKNEKYLQQMQQKEFQEWQKSFEQTSPELDLADLEISEQEEFEAYVLRLGNIIKDDTLVSALEDLVLQQLSPESIAVSISESYLAYYNQFHDGKRNVENVDLMLDTLEEFIVDLEAEADDMSSAYYAQPIIAELRSIGNRIHHQQAVQNEGATQ
jgi:proteasome lid subunit RPN8/RPN11